MDEGGWADFPIRPTLCSEKRKERRGAEGGRQTGKVIFTLLLLSFLLLFSVSGFITQLFFFPRLRQSHLGEAVDSKLLEGRRLSEGKTRRIVYPDGDCWESEAEMHADLIFRRANSCSVGWKRVVPIEAERAVFMYTCWFTELRALEPRIPQCLYIL